MKDRIPAQLIIANTALAIGLILGIITLDKSIQALHEGILFELDQIEARQTALASRIERIVLEQGQAVQLGSLSSEEAHKLNVDLAAALAAHAGCNVRLGLSCSVEEEEGE